MSGCAALLAEALARPAFRKELPLWGPDFLKKATHPCHITGHCPLPSPRVSDTRHSLFLVCGHRGFHGWYKVLCVLETVNKKVGGKKKKRLALKLTQTLNLRLLEGTSGVKLSQTANIPSAGSRFRRDWCFCHYGGLGWPVHTEELRSFFKFLKARCPLPATTLTPPPNPSSPAPNLPASPEDGPLLQGLLAAPSKS